MKKLLMIAIAISIFASCKQEEIISDTTDNQIAEVAYSRNEDKGILSFGSAEELQVFIKEHQTTDLLDVAREFAEERRYIPLLLVYNSTTEEAKELGLTEEELPKVASEDDMLLFLLNENGEIGIEDKIYRIDGDFVYTYTRGSSKDITIFQNKYKEKGIKISRGKTIEFSENLTVYMHNNVQSKEEASLISGRNKGFEHFDNDHRMRAKQFNGYWKFYSSIGAKTTVQEKKRFLWWNWWKNIKGYNRLQTDVNYRVEYVGDKYYYYYQDKAEFHENYANNLEVFFEYSVGFPSAPFKYTPISGKTIHWAHWYGGGAGSKNTVSKTLYY